ncbi:MAG: hypothetical protein PHU52_06025 [Dehalococcoidales bacterium]|jgi:hypothetical protein|nr:hypothetical protein [Dehalococcoidales bacterium]
MSDVLILTLTKADKKYNRIAIPASIYRNNRGFFPAPGTCFKLITSKGTIETNLRPANPKRISMGLKPLIENNPSIQPGAKIAFIKTSNELFYLYRLVDF